MICIVENLERLLRHIRSASTYFLRMTVRLRNRPIGGRCMQTTRANASFVCHTPRLWPLFALGGNPGPRAYWSSDSPWSTHRWNPEHRKTLKDCKDIDISLIHFLEHRLRQRSRGNGLHLRSTRVMDDCHDFRLSAFSENPLMILPTLGVCQCVARRQQSSVSRFFAKGSLRLGSSLISLARCPWASIATRLRLSEAIVGENRTDLAHPRPMVGLIKNTLEPPTSLGFPPATPRWHRLRIARDEVPLSRIWPPRS